MNLFKEKKLTNFIIAIGNNKIRKQVADRLEFTKVVMFNSSVNAFSSIGRHFITNTTSIDHDWTPADYLDISPQVGLAGNVSIGGATDVGIDACIIQGIQIGKWVAIGAGALIIDDVPDYAIVVGNLEKIIKYNNHER